MIDRLVFYATFNTISVISLWQLTYMFLLEFISSLAHGHSDEKPKGSSVVQTKSLEFIGQTLYNWATSSLAQGHPHEKPSDPV